MKKLRTIACCLFAACLLANVASAQRFTVTDIGSLDLGGPFDVSYGYALNNRGEVVGASFTPEYNLHAFRWTKSSGIHDLGTLGGPTSAAYGINDSEQVVGQADVGNGLTHAFLWTKGEGLQDLGLLAPFSSYAYAINGRSQVVGQAFFSKNAAHAFLWSPETGMQDLGALDDGTNSVAYAINDRGEVVGASDTENGSTHAFLWTKETGMQDLGDVAGLGSIALGISRSGETVGYAGTTQAFTFTYGLRWESVHSRHVLPFAPGSTQNFPIGINNANHITVYFTDALGFYNAFLYSKAHGLQNLNKLISSKSRWSLAIGTAINNEEQITGCGPVVINGNAVNHAFLLSRIK